MQIPEYLYTFRYDFIESKLSKLESRYIFNKEENHKRLLSNKKIDPSHSAFIKARLDIICKSGDYATLLDDIKAENIKIEGFKVEYLVCQGDEIPYEERLSKLKDIGFSIEGIPDYHHPRATYVLCYYEQNWCFGLTVKNSFEWMKHKQKPVSYSNSIGQHMAKALVNLATKANKQVTLLDACCGVGTIMIEACYAGYDIEGCDINWKISKNARTNLAHFNYTAEVHHKDISDLAGIDKRYDAAIVDLPYNLFSSASDSDIVYIIAAAARIADRLVIVSISDITAPIINAGLRISDYCSVRKNGKKSFERRIWVCEHEEGDTSK